MNYALDIIINVKGPKMHSLSIYATNISTGFPRMRQLQKSMYKSMFHEILPKKISIRRLIVETISIWCTAISQYHYMTRFILCDTLYSMWHAFFHEDLVANTKLSYFTQLFRFFSQAYFADLMIPAVKIPFNDCINAG